MHHFCHAERSRSATLSLQQMIYIRRYYYVYILKCADNSFYTGISNDVERRLAEHMEGKTRIAIPFPEDRWNWYIANIS